MERLYGWQVVYNFMGKVDLVLRKGVYHEYFHIYGKTWRITKNERNGKNKRFD